MGIEYIRTPNGVRAEWQVEGQLLWLEARNLARSRLGVMGKLRLGVNGVVLAWGHIGLERVEERGRLAREAWKALGEGLKEAVDQAVYLAWVSNFCEGVWDYLLLEVEPEPLPGAPDLPISYLAKPLVLEGGGSVLFAPPGTGKSYTAMLVAVMVDAGASILFPVKQTPALFVNLERSKESIQRRLGHINRVLGLEPDRPLLTLSARGRTLAEVAEAVDRVVQREGIGFLVLDSISRTGLGSLTEDLPVNRVVDLLNRLCPTWLGIAHTPRDSGDHAYGSIMLDAGADMLWALSSRHLSQRLEITLSLRKANDVPKHAPITLALEFSQDSTLTKAYRLDTPGPVAQPTPKPNPPPWP